MGTNTENTEVDDRGTSQDEALLELKRLRDEVFNSNNKELALALGRTPEQVESWISGEEVIDDDVLMKARGIAQARGAEIDGTASKEEPSHEKAAG